MNLETIRDYCLQKAGVEESLPFGPDVIVFKVKGKVFLLLPLDTETLQFNVKCDPDRAEELRAAISLCITRISYEQKTLEHDYCRRFGFREPD